MRVHVAVALASALLGAGCLASPAGGERENGPHGGDGTRERSAGSPANEADVVTSGEALAAPAAMPSPRIVPLLLGCRALHVIDHASPWVPPLEWIPPGYRLSSVGGDSAASYELNVVRCPTLALDNQTLLHDVAFAYLTAILEAGPEAQGALPSHNLLLIDAYVDQPALAQAFVAAGLTPPIEASIRWSEAPGGTRVDVQGDGASLLQAFVQTNDTYGALADRVKAERMHTATVDGLHQWWDVSYVHDQVSLTTAGSITILGGRAASLAPAGSFALHGNGLDHRDVRGELRLAV